jgi:hypothetical protein
MAPSAPPKSQAVLNLLSSLRVYLPAAVIPLPAPSVTIFSLQERNVGLGNRLGRETLDNFAIVELKAGQLDAVVCLQIWATRVEDADLAVDQLHGRLLADKEGLRVEGFLRLAAEETLLAEYIPSLNAWRKTAKYRVLYEYRYTDSNGAESLITQIPIAIDSQYNEVTTVTGLMVRWDNQTASPLLLRGRAQVVSLSALVFIPGLPPNGSVTLRRTYDGATGIITSYSSLGNFLSAVAGTNPNQRQGQYTFSTLRDFLAAFTTGGDAIPLGDWDENAVPDNYESQTLTLTPIISLPTSSDRLEISYQNPAFERVAVVYLRATSG